MTKVYKRRGLGFGLILTAGAALALATPALASAASPSAHAGTMSAAQAIASAQGAHVSGLVPATPIASELSGPATPPPFVGSPPLFFRGAAGCFAPPCFGGNVLMTQETGPLVITPIFWNPPGHSFAPGYKGIITQYLADVAQASGQNTNVYSVANQYSGNNGQIHYNIQLGSPINDRSPLPADGCTLEAVDTTAIYADNSGYNACLDDAQLQAEVDRVTAARGLPHNLSNMYVLYLPKAVESCFFAGATNTNQNACTINHLPSAAFCAYHNNALSGAVYADMAYPIYHSPVHFTCGSDARRAGFGAIQAPNNNPDADTEISPTSHEVVEAITDPDGETGWGDAIGNEIGDDCAYIYGTPSGPAGQFYNQTIDGQHYLTQEEFSNNVFFASGGTAGCVQSAG